MRATKKNQWVPRLKRGQVKRIVWLRDKANHPGYKKQTFGFTDRVSLAGQVGSSRVESDRVGSSRVRVTPPRSARGLDTS